MVPYAGNGFGLSLRCLGRLLPVLGEFLLLRNSQSPGPGPSGPSLLHATGGLKRSYRSASGPPAPRATSTADLLPEAVKAALEVGGGSGPRSSRRKSARRAAAAQPPGGTPPPTRRGRRRPVPQHVLAVARDRAITAPPQRCVRLGLRKHARHLAPRSQYGAPTSTSCPGSRRPSGSQPTGPPGPGPGSPERRGAPRGAQPSGPARRCSLR